GTCSTLPSTRTPRHCWARSRSWAAKSRSMPSRASPRTWPISRRDALFTRVVRMPCHVVRRTSPRSYVLRPTGRPDAGSWIRSTMTAPLLEVQGLQKYFPVKTGLFLQRQTAWVKAVDGVEFAIYPGETLGLIGESGCGKTTTSKLI